MATRWLLPLALLAASAACVQADETVIGDASELALTLGPDGRARYTQEYDQEGATVDQRAFAVEGTVTWRDKQWQDLSLNGSRVVYKLRLSRPVARLQLSASFWGTKATEGLVWASADGQKWSRVWAYDPATAPEARVSGAADLAPYQSKEAQPAVYLKLGTETKWGLLYGWSLLAQEKTPPPAVPYKPGPVPPDGALRYCIQYGDVSAELLDMLRNARCNFLHWHGPFYGYTGLPERSKHEGLVRGARATIDEVHAAGMACILYIGPCFSYGDKDKRTQLFEFYDKRWSQYEDYFGKRPGDLLEMAQCDAQGRPRPYVYEGQSGYHLCVNSPGVRQMTKGLIRMIVEAGGDGSFYDGPYVTEGRCYCRWCREKFRTWLRDSYGAADLERHFGVSDPATVELPRTATDKLWVPFRRFSAWSLLDFMRDTKAYGRSLNPHYLMTSNYCMWEGEPFGPIRGTAEDAEVESQVVDVLFDESKYGAGPHLEGDTRVSNSSDYRHLLAAAQGVPVALLKTAPEGNTAEAGGNLTRLAIAEGAANGATWQLHRLKPAAAAAAEQYSSFLASRQAVLARCRPWATVAVWCSNTQAYFDAPTYPTAVSRFLADRHVPHRFVTDAEVAAGKLGEYDVLIVPEVRVISDRQLTALGAFVSEGNGLVLLGQCGVLDEWGEARRRLPLEQAASADAPLQKPLDAGRVLYLPAASLSRTACNGLPAPDQARLAPLADGLEWLAGNCPPAVLPGAPHLEVTTSWDRKQTLVVHLVNYAVDLAGEVTPRRNQAVEVRLPRGLVALSPGRLYRPEAPGGTPVPCEVSYPGPESVVRFTVPEVGVYSQVECRLGRGKKPSDLPLLARAVGEAAPGATVTIEAGLPVTMEGVQWRLEPDRRWTATGGATARGGASYQLTLSADVAPGPVAVRVHATFHGATLSRLVWLDVRAPLEATLRLPAFVNPIGGRTRAELSIRNRLSEALAAQMKLTLPEGWAAEGLPPAVTVPARQVVPMVFWLQAPAGVKPGSYRLAAQASAGKRTGAAEAVLAVPEKLKGLAVPYAATPPALDGKLDDACWAAAAVAGDFQRTDGKGSARQQTVARVCYDARGLYLAFECDESEPETIISLIGQDGGEVWRDDSVEVFVDSTLARRDVWHWTANTQGRRTTAQWWQCAAARTARGWAVEMVLPVTEKVQPGDMWGANFCRTRPSRPQNEPEYSAWAPVPGSFWHPEAFGVLVFGGR